MGNSPGRCQIGNVNGFDITQPYYLSKTFENNCNPLIKSNISDIKITPIKSDIDFSFDIFIGENNFFLKGTPILAYAAYADAVKTSTFAYIKAVNNKYNSYMVGTPYIVKGFTVPDYRYGTAHFDIVIETALAKITYSFIEGIFYNFFNIPVSFVII